VKLGDPSEGLKRTELENVALTGETLDAYESFWDRAAQVDFVKAIADQDDNESFEASGADVAAQLVPHIDRAAKVLEVGCGAGRIMQHLAELAAEVHGVDISTEMVSRGTERLKHLSNAHFHHGNGYDLADFANGSFQLVYSDITFQHMPKTTAYNYMIEVGRVLAPGGWFWLQVPNLLDDDHWLEFRHFTQPYFVEHPYPMNFYTPAEVVRMLVRAGFQVRSMTYEMVVEAVKAGEPGIAQTVRDQILDSARHELVLLAGPEPEPPPPPPPPPRAIRLANRLKRS
jgi:ubiquinone/menaquinone biosynthesis C-methylase UbiE